MSIQYKDYTSKKTGLVKRKFYAAVWDSSHGRLITGPYHNVEGPNLPEPDKLPRTLERELRLDEAAIIQAIRQGTVEKKRTSTRVQDVAKLWLDSSKGIYSNSTYTIYTEYYDHYIKNIFGDRPVNKVQAIHIQRFVTAMENKYSPETVNKCISILSNIFAYAVDPLQEISSNPASGIRRLKVPRKKRGVWKEEEIQYFLNLPEVKASHYYGMLCISLLLGLRPSEVCGLSEDSLQDNPARLELHRGYDRYGTVSSMKTDGSHRVIPIPRSIYKIIRHWLIWKKEERLRDPVFADNDFLFVSELGNPIKPDTYSRAFRRLLTSNNAPLKDLPKLPEGKMLLPEISLYGCRHSFATNALAQENDAALISSIMGNSVKTLLTFYAHPDEDRKRRLINEYIKKSSKIV